LLADEPVEGQDHHVLRVQSQTQDIRVVIDPSTHLVRRMHFDLSRSLLARGVPEVKVASVVIDYESTQTGGVVDDSRFEWSPPAGAAVARNAPVGGAGEGSPAEGSRRPERVGPGK
jgi:hypothetical protein